MENYEIKFRESERESVLKILSTSNDILINNITPTSVGITIQQDEAEPLYHSILEKIDREVHSPVAPAQPLRRTDMDTLL